MAKNAIFYRRSSFVRLGVRGRKLTFSALATVLKHFKFNHGGIMNIDQLTEQLDEYSQAKQVCFVSESGPNTCDECSNNDGKIFNIDDPDLPRLPVHPNCRCKYVSADDQQQDVTAQVEEHMTT